MTLPVDGVNPFDQPDWPPEPCAGDTHTDSQERKWTCFWIVGGRKGGRWAYLTSDGHVLVDDRQNLQASHFQGMLSIPWDGLTKLGWVLAKEHCQPVHEKLVPEPPEAIRFERLSEPPKED